MREIPLSQGKVALVDDADYDKAVSFGKWYAAKSGRTWYAQRVTGSRPRRTIQLHRFLMDDPPGMEIDHHNQDGLDCRRTNLRICRPAGNRQNVGRKASNTSGFKGVHFQDGKWRARLSLGPRGDSKYLSLGMFDSPEEAARAHDAAAKKHRGEFAWLNFPEGV